MSMELHVFLTKARLPDIAQLQATIDDLGFDLKLDPEVTVAAHMGFLPATLMGRESGFEFDVGPAADIADTYPDFAQQLAVFDRAANFRWCANLDEMTCALAAAAALTRVCDGVWFDPQEGECRDAAGAIQVARTGLESAR